jgi:hypothetical protein
MLTGILAASIHPQTLQAEQHRKCYSVADPHFSQIRKNWARAADGENPHEANHADA